MSTMPRNTSVRSTHSRDFADVLVGVAALAIAGALLVLAGCETPAHDKDTNASKYNYSYNK